jgi:hypothetical protein
VSRVASKIYVPLDVAFFDDARMVEAGEKAQYLYLNMLTKAKGVDSDGVLTKAQVARLAVPGWQSRLRALEAVGAVTITGDQVQIVSWLRWNESADARRQRLEEDRRRKAEAAERKARQAAQKATDSE